MKPYQIAYSAALLLLAASLLSCADYPITGSLSFRDPDSGAKAGLVFVPNQKPTVSVKVPYYGENGELLGMLEVGTTHQVVVPPVISPEK